MVVATLRPRLRLLDQPPRTSSLTAFLLLLRQVQNLLQQMQGRFSTMSDAIIGRSTQCE